ncbi:extracellular serine-rich protein [Colletotrichum graminicola]|uniref:Extracellular serine-rich protein n=1 Tax=Colletotrichum graminicola (strain M1.001 / M2 / FGSC 10212) TaxID=645133 RepID=E3QEW8_COLGM|nr:extracellular serine-rich protein [Colletotrichum graminicola M1.001]EFQ29424.1 extracellular serine-rich protein [Colletotrichum graminicola M1.001]WDK13920.1 extracellular serine-rich protein [Colletotrichum graminicola]
MVRSSVYGVAALAILVKAQSPVTPTPFLTTTTTTTTPNGGSTTTLNVRSEATATSMGNASATAAETHTIAVGVSGFSFTPSKVDANVGDTIEWLFYPDGHSVIRSEFGFPCTPYEYVDIGRQGFYSGNTSVKAITNDMPRFRVLVNDTNPIFFYCGAPGSCYKEKMIGVINENSTQTLAKQLEAALTLTTQIIPGEPFPIESDGPNPTSSSGSANGNSSAITYHPGLSGGQIVGVAIGSLAFLLLGGFLVYMCGRQSAIDRAYRRASNRQEAPSNPPQPDIPEPPVAEINEPARSKTPTFPDWRGSHYTSFSGGPYRDTAGVSEMTSPRLRGFSHPTEGMQTYFDSRISSIAPSSIVEAPNNQATSPPVLAPVSGSRAGPVELPTYGDPEHSPYPQLGWRFSFAGQDSEYRLSKEG